MKPLEIDALLPHLTKIRDRFGETAGLAVLDEAAAVGIVVAAVQATGRFAFALSVGQRFPVHTGAPAKAMLAFLPKPRLEALLAKVVLRKFTETTVTSRRAFRAELAAIRKCGFALDRAEEVEGCHCLAVPVFGADGLPVAGVWFTGPSNRLPIKTLPNAYPALRALTDALQRELRKKRTEKDGATQTSDAMGQALRVLDAAALTEKTDFASLARTLGMSYSAFRHVFKDQIGMGPAQYLLSRRLDEARRLLTETTRSVAAIAEQTGFSSPSHFSTLFKRKAGLSPHAFRLRNPSSEKTTREVDRGVRCHV